MGYWVLIFVPFTYNFQMHYVYILKMLDDRLYVGVAEDLRRRLSLHRQGNVGTRTTGIFGADSMPYHEEFPDLKSALKRGRQIKKVVPGQEIGVD
jgi:predicted GIY-YIG superfamily endonuclease